MKQWIKWSVPVVALALTIGSASAVPIIGSVNFDGGTVTLNGSPSTATAITAFAGTTIVNNNAGVGPTGAFAGTGGDSVTFVSTGFQFSPTLAPNPVNPLWTYYDATTKQTYSFSLMSITSSVGVGPSLNLAGTGTLTITGGVTTYDPTGASFTLSTTGTGPAIFGFVAGNVSVPDGGTTVMLLGAAVLGLGLLKRKMALAV